MRKTMLAAAMLLVSTVTYGADLTPVKAPLRAIASVAAFNWSGFYLGAHVDCGANVTDMLTSIGAGNTTVDLAAIPRGCGLGGDIQGLYQSTGSPWVLGLVADIGWINLYSTGNVSSAGVNFLSVSNDTSYLGSIDAKLGYAIDPRVLLYVTGGFGFGGEKANLTAANLCLVGQICAQAISDTSVGYHVGGGIDFAIPQTVADVYLQTDWYDLGSHSLSIPSTVAGAAPIATSTARIQVLKESLGVHIKFGGAS